MSRATTGAIIAVILLLLEFEAANLHMGMLSTVLSQS